LKTSSVSHIVGNLVKVKNGYDMQVVRDINDIDVVALKKPVVTIGNFDGCHAGHQEIFRRARLHASRIGGVTVVYTFDPHPASVVKGVVPQLIFTLNEKIEAVQTLGMDFLVIAPFTREIAETHPEIFVRETIMNRLKAEGVVVGHDFAFGRKAEGDIPFLERMGEKLGFFVECVDPVTIDNVVVSSTTIRKMILSGDVSGASRLMIHPFRIHGPVVHGMSRGRALGFPTANIIPDKALIPAYGVYAVYISTADRCFKGVVNIGNNPTFGDVGTSIEAFIFDFQGDLYDQIITIEFVEYIRGEIKFADKSYLVDQMKEDCRKAKEILS
jgi:riboflavin kinase/FMN adenylyltransferase